MRIWHEEALAGSFRLEAGRQDTKRYFHWHSYLEILLVMTDGVECVLEWESRTLRRGELLLIPPYCLHCVYSDRPGGALVCLIQCEETLLRGTAWASRRGGENECLLYASDALTEPLLATASFLLAGEGEKARRLQADWIRGLADLLCLYGDARRRPDEAEGDGGLRAMIAQCAFIREHMGESLRVPVLAARAGYSVSHFSRLFQRAIGCSPAEYVTKVRIRQAQMLLRSSEASVTEIAYRLGFSNPNNFARTYRRLLGHPPSADREEGNVP